MSRVRAAVWSAIPVIAIVLSGCAGSGGGDPGAKALPVGESCQSIRGQLDRLLGKGVQGNVEALSAGRKLSPGARADAEAYNRLLNHYLGARCHVAPT